jgi:hypothetical protein
MATEKKASPVNSSKTSISEDDVSFQLAMGSIMAPRKCTIPTSIRFLGRTFPVIMRTKDSGFSDNGLFDHDTLTIQIKEGQIPAEEVDTILHETVHGISYFMDLNLSERQVRLIATGLVALFQDNPEFAEYLTQPFKDNE